LPLLIVSSAFLLCTVLLATHESRSPTPQTAPRIESDATGKKLSVREAVVGIGEEEQQLERKRSAGRRIAQQAVWSGAAHFAPGVRCSHKASPPLFSVSSHSNPFPLRI